MADREEILRQCRKIRVAYRSMLAVFWVLFALYTAVLVYFFFLGGLEKIFEEIAGHLDYLFAPASTGSGSESDGGILGRIALDAILIVIAYGVFLLPTSVILFPALSLRKKYKEMMYALENGGFEETPPEVG